MEIPFSFGTLRDAVLRTLFAFAPGAHRLSRAMQQVWIAMARSGNPGSEALPQWPAYDPARRPTLIFERRCAVEEAPFEDERRFWSSYL
jgi:para-nitrobenzyl esterase